MYNFLRKLYMVRIKYGQPKRLPLTKLSPASYYRELAAASYSLGMLQVAHGKIRNSDHLIKPLLTREASLSSKIEGTITDSKDVFILDATGRALKQDTVVVANYRRAMHLAASFKDDRKITSPKIRQLHTILLRGTPFKGTLGKFREVDAWIGKNQNTPIDKAIYVCPQFVQVPAYIENLLSYFNNFDEDPIVKVAIFHYQFEAVHPFEDGNGRIGRMLIPALLNYQGSLSAPVLYTSEYFEKEADKYRQKLHEVDVSGDITPWVKFFLESIKGQCDLSINLVDRILALNAELHERYESSQSPNIIRVIDFMFENPAFTISEIVNKLKITRLTASKTVQALVDDKVAEEFTAIKADHNARIYIFPRLVDLISS